MGNNDNNEVSSVSRRSNDKRPLREKNCFSEKDGKLVFSYDCETLTVDAWGKDSLRVRATKLCCFPETDWALIPSKINKADIKIDEENGTAQITNGKITARFTWVGVLEILNSRKTASESTAGGNYGRSRFSFRSTKRNMELHSRGRKNLHRLYFYA